MINTQTFFLFCLELFDAYYIFHWYFSRMKYNLYQISRETLFFQICSEGQLPLSPAHAYYTYQGGLYLKPTFSMRHCIAQPKLIADGRECKTTRKWCVCGTTWYTIWQTRYALETRTPYTYQIMYEHGSASLQRVECRWRTGEISRLCVCVTVRNVMVRKVPLPLPPLQFNADCSD